MAKSVSKKINRRPSSSKSKSKSKRTVLQRIGVFLAKSLMWFFIVTVGLVLFYRFVPVYYTPLMFIRLVEQAANGEDLKLERDWVSIDEISNKMCNAVIAAEDNLFMEHNGFDINGIKRAFKNNQRKKKKIQGGSTISQQTAKNVFLYPDRSYVRKGFEAYFTVLIELVWPKERILEVYLNVVELGNGIYGVEAASQIYYSKPSSKLTNNESALLAVCLPNPRKYCPANPNSYLLKRKSKVKKLQNQLGRFKFPEIQE